MSTQKPVKLSKAAQAALTHFERLEDITADKLYAIKGCGRKAVVQIAVLMSRQGLEMVWDAGQAKAANNAKKETGRSTVQVKLRLPADVAEALDALAEKRGATRSELVAVLLEESKAK